MAPPKRRSSPARGLPRKHVPVVTHQGDLDPSAKQSHSYEGPALSVTTPEHQEDWQRIARLGGKPVHTLRGGLFLHASAMSGEQWKNVEQWGVRQGHVRPTRQWQAISSDEDGSEMFSLHDTPDEAWQEGERVRPVKTVVPTSDEARGMPGRDYALMKLAQATGKAGVWWSDENDGAWSAPRGGLIR